MKNRLRVLSVIGVVLIGTMLSACGSSSSASSPTSATVQANPAPAILALSPASAIVSDIAVELTVNGNNFIASSSVDWNGTPLATQVVDATTLKATVPAGGIATEGTVSVAVINPAPGGGRSVALNFNVFKIVAVPNPLPAIASLSPNSVNVGAAPFMLTVNGNNFLPSSSVNWNGTALVTKFVNATELSATVPVTETSGVGNDTVTVSNPPPAGGTSGSANFAVVSSATHLNPLPVIASLPVNNVKAGSAAFTFTVNGSNFIASSVLRWNGAALSTHYVDATQLTASISAASVATAGAAIVSVASPAPGGGTSNSVTFSVYSPVATPNPVPTVTSLSPNNTNAGGIDFQLIVNGSNFVPASVVVWSGGSLPTTYLSATQLTAMVLHGNIASAGTASVTVVSPAPGGGTSASALNFAINNVNPAPVITSLPVNSVEAGSAAFTLTINGSNFIASSAVIWNGAALGTHVSSATQITASIPAAIIATAGTAFVSVANPTPGGGTSNTVSFSIASNPGPAPGPGPTLVQYNTYNTISNTTQNDSTLQFHGNTKAGNTIWVVVTLSDYAGVHNETTVTDTQGNTYIKLNQVNDPASMPDPLNPQQSIMGGAQSVAQFYATRIAGDASAPATITVHWGTEDYKGILVTEISGTSGAPLVGFSGGFQDQLAGGNENVTSGNITVNAAQTPALVLALCFNTLQIAPLPNACVPGAGFNKTTTLWDWGLNRGPSSVLETALVGAAGNVAVRFSAPGMDNYVTIAAVFH